VEEKVRFDQYLFSHQRKIDYHRVAHHNIIVIHSSHQNIIRHSTEEDTGSE